MNYQITIGKVLSFILKSDISMPTQEKIVPHIWNIRENNNFQVASSKLEKVYQILKTSKTEQEMLKVLNIQ